MHPLRLPSFVLAILQWVWETCSASPMYRDVLMNVSENLDTSIIDVLASEESVLHMEARRDAHNKKPQTNEGPGIPITHTKSYRVQCSSPNSTE